MKVNLTDPKIKQVTEFWDKLYANGSISHDADFNDAWYQGFAKGKYAGWLSAAWGPIFLQDYTKSSKGEWRAAAAAAVERGQDRLRQLGRLDAGRPEGLAEHGGGGRVRALDPPREAAGRDVLV